MCTALGERNGHGENRVNREKFKMEPSKAENIIKANTYYNKLILQTFGDKEYAYNQIALIYGKDIADEVTKQHPRGWKEAPDAISGKAPEHQQAAIKAVWKYKVNDVLRKPMEK